MNKLIITMIAIVVVIGAMFMAVAIFTPNRNDDAQKIQTEIAEEEILDDCTDEYEGAEYEDTIKANTQEEKTSPNCSLTTKTYYRKCGHTKSEYTNLPSSFVNLTKEEIQEKYQEYEIENFATNAIVLYQEKEDEGTIVDVTLKIAKQRAGEIGKVYLKFNKAMSEFKGVMRC